jgi:hypothetical protein
MTRFDEYLVKIIFERRFDQAENIRFTFEVIAFRHQLAHTLSKSPNPLPTLECAYSQYASNVEYWRLCSPPSCHQEMPP